MHPVHSNKIILSYYLKFIPELLMPRKPWLLVHLCTQNTNLEVLWGESTKYVCLGFGIRHRLVNG